MEIDDIQYACERIANIFYIPVRLFDGNCLACTFAMSEMRIDPAAPFIDTLFDLEKHVQYFQSPFHQYFGVIAVQSYRIILGPVGRVEFTMLERKSYAAVLGISQAAFDHLYKQMLSIPHYSLHHFLHMLLFVNFLINRQKLKFSDIYGLSLASDGRQENLSSETLQRENDQETALVSVNSMLSFERRLLTMVRTGDIIGLEKLLETGTHGTTLPLSKDDFQSIKNFFITSVALVSRAASESGMFDEDALKLSSLYILQCEECATKGDVVKLLGQMARDFTRRVSESENVHYMSDVTSQTISYIKQHISQTLEVQELAKRVFVSNKTLTSKFKSETGKTVREFISDERIRMAELLLRYTDKSLVEIAENLGYASQSHFQTRFKQVERITPLEYRKTTQTTK